MSAYKDAQAQNDISRNAKQYSDLDLFFTKKTVGSDVNKVTEEVKKEVLFILPNNPPGPITVLPTSTPSFEPLFNINCLHQLPVFLEITAAEI